MNKTKINGGSFIFIIVGKKGRLKEKNRLFSVSLDPEKGEGSEKKYTSSVGQAP